VTLGQKSSITVARIDEGKGLPVGVPDDIAAWHWVGVPGRREAAGWFCRHGAIAKKKAPVRLAMGGFRPRMLGARSGLTFIHPAFMKG
jgi:hypothetical protein